MSWNWIVKKDTKVKVDYSGYSLDDYERMTRPSGNTFGNELYEFVEYGSSGTSKYRDQYGRLVDFSVDDLVVVCPYCRSKNNQHNFTCAQCGAPL